MINRILIILALLLGLLPAQAQFQSVTTTANGTLHSPTNLWAQNSLAIANALAANPGPLDVATATVYNDFANYMRSQGAGNATVVTEPDRILGVMAEIYRVVGRSAVVDAWFLRPAQNPSLGGSATVRSWFGLYNGVAKTGSPLVDETTPTFSNDYGYRANSSATKRIMIPSAINAVISDEFTVFAVTRAVNENQSATPLGSAATVSGQSRGWNLLVRNDANRGNSLLRMDFMDESGTTVQTVATGRPLALSKFNVACGILNGGVESGIFVNGFLQERKATTNLLSTTATLIGIGGGARVDFSTPAGTNPTETTFVLFVKGALDNWQIRQISDALRAFTTPVPQTYNVVCEGDSITGGQGNNAVTDGDVWVINPATQAGGYAWWHVLDGLKPNAFVRGVGAGGDRAQWVLNGGQYEGQTRPWRPSKAIPNAVACIWLGTNDIANGATAAATYDRLKQLWAKARADGFKVCAFAVLKRDDVSAGINDEIVVLNGLIESDPTLYDFYADFYTFFADPANNPTYTDGLHPTIDGNQWIAEQLDAILDID
jgi:lysophospholipase L1-like esterase